MKLLIDMNLSPRWLDVLSQAQFDAAHWSDVGAATAPARALVSVEPQRIRSRLLPLRPKEEP